MRPKPLRNSTGSRLLQLFTGVSVMLMSAATTVFAVPPNTVTLPDFSIDVLTPLSQAANAWTNTIPNALASYYTYVPYSNADAVALGFPAACGNKALATPADVASTADCYTITVRKFAQPLSLDFLKYVGIPGFPGKGLIKPDGVTPFVDTASPTVPTNFLNPALSTLTTAWGYGSGGVGWTPPYQKAVPPKVVTGNAPAAFANVPFASLFGPGANGNTTDTGVWHFPAPSIKGTKNREVYVQWANDLPNERPVGHDPSVDCGVNAPNCFPYNRIITHVHGAHVTPESDGLATGWFTPNFLLQGENAFPPSAFFDIHPAPAGTVPFGPRGTYRYPMTQEAGTIWYHDHAVGTTHTNTDMGMAGFFPITDLNEQSLLTPLAGPAKALPNTLYDYGFAMQDRNFDINGQMVMPDYAIYNKTDPACTLTIDGLPDPATCPRLQWMKDVDGHLIPYNPLSPLLLNANNIGTANLTGPFEIPGQGAPFPATSATLEYFGNMPVVNGVTYGKINIEARINRMRFIGGTDSRTWIMQLRTVDPLTNLVTPTIVPFYQIAAEQGLLNKPVLRNDIDLMGGERIDVLVDFSALAPGTKVRMINFGADTPYSGRQDYLAGLIVPSTDIPEIMEFDIVAKTIANVDSTPIATLLAAVNPLRPYTFALADGSGLSIGAPPVPVITRNVSLIEITDQYGRTMPTIDGRGFIPPGMPTTEIIFPNQVEEWDIINTTVDAHPMHIHQVSFQTINRQAIDFFAAPGADKVAQIFTPPQYTVQGAVLPADPWEVSGKDTIQCPPGYVTRVRMVFDLLGDYVWHCHILSHEEHDMMRPFKVTTVAPAPSFINVPSTNTTGRFAISWGGTSIPGAQFVLQQKIAPAAAFTTIYTGAATTLSAFNKAAGTYSYQVGVVAPPFIASAFTAASNGGAGLSPTATIAVSFPPAITPAPLTPAGVQTVLPATATQVFSWPNTGASLYQLWVGTTGVGSRNLYSAAASIATTATVAVPANGGVIYVRLWSKTGTTWTFLDFTYTAAPALAITTASPVTYTPGAAAVNTQLVASGGVGPFTWTAPLGLPAGLTMNTAGLLAGVPTGSTGSYNFTITVKDSQTVPVTVVKAFTLTINPNPAIPVITTASPLTPYTLGTGIYSVTLAATAGTAPYSWAVTLPSVIPAGLTLNAATGVLSGTPTVAGTYNFTLQVTDSKVPAPATTTTKAFTLVVNPAAVIPVAITTAALPNGAVNAAYNLAAAATGGTAPFTWSATGLPTGLTIAPATGVISGTPANVVPVGASATFSVSLTVQDSTLATANKVLNLTINQTAPAAASLLAATASPGKVVLNWTQNANNSAGVLVQRATDAAFTIGLTTVYAYGPALTTYTDNTVAALTTYFYRVSNLNYVISSTSSNTATVTTP